MGTSPRYRFFVQVDAAALSSVLHDAPAAPEPDATKKGWVKLINKDWIPRSENPRLRHRPDPNVYEPIEGGTECDVGWMKCPYQSVMTEHYVNTVDLHGWGLNYRRPPVVAGWPYNE